MPSSKRRSPAFRIEPIFDGCKVVIIGGGTSVTPAQIHTIAKARLDLGSKVRVISINDAIFLAWWSDWLHACDGKWWRWHIQRVQWFPGLKTTLADDIPPEWAGRLENTGKEGFDPDPSAVRTGHNGGYQAMHCAIHAGAKEIVLVGIDLDRETHWFGKHPNDVDVDRGALMLPMFAGLVPELERRKIKVWNASPISRLEIWPKISIETVLEGKV
jgi:hypothetical protein